MKINDEFLVIKKGEIKEGKNGNKYFMVDIVDGDGTVFNLMCSDLVRYNDFIQFNKIVLDLELTNSRYGLSLKII